MTVNLTSFITQALPWVTKMVFPQGIMPELLEKFQKLAFNVSGSSDLSAYSKILGSDALLKQYQLEASRIKNEYYKYTNIDRMNARQRDTSLRHMRSGNTRAEIMVYIAFGGLVASILGLFFFSSYMSVEVAGILSTIISVFMACLRDIYVFEFGQETKMHATQSHLS